MDRSQMSQEQFAEITSLLRTISRAQESLGAAVTAFGIKGLDESDPDHAIRWLREQIGQVRDELNVHSHQLDQAERIHGSPPENDVWGPWEELDES